MAPNSAVVELVNFLNRKIRESAKSGNAMFSVTNANSTELFEACPAFGALERGSRAACIEKCQEMLVSAGYECELCEHGTLINIKWVGVKK